MDDKIPADDEGRYRLLVDNIIDYAIYMLDPQGIVTSWNAGAERFKGYQAGEIIGQHFSAFYTDEDRAAGVPEAALRQAASEGRFEMEGWRIRKDGTRFWAHVVIDAIRDPVNGLIGYAKITRDLTERRAAQVALQRSEEQFRLLVKGVTDYAIYMLDPTGQVTNWNLGAERIKGYVPDEIIGQNFARFYSPDDQAAGIPQRGLATAEREGRFETEGWRFRKDGARFWAHVIIDAIRDDAGELIGFAKVTRDVTERQNAQRALELAREALFQSQKLEAIGQLTGGIAHDFNNLLMAVLGSLELVKKRLPADPAIERLINNAMLGAQRGTSLTQRMLAFARRSELNRQAVDISGLVLGMSGLLDRVLGPTTSIETRLPSGLPPVETDPAQLESALMNLVLNARDAMPAGGLIQIAAEKAQAEDGEVQGLKPGPYVRLSVSDTGEGMDANTLARATEPFFTTKGVGKGTGLGLSMVYGLVEQTGGALRLTSTLGEGSTVELWLPLAAGPVVAAGQTDAAASDDAGGRSLVVLAVDDDALVLLNTVAMLEDLGHTVVQAESAATALRIFRANSAIDLVITDQVMPKMTGAQMAEAMKAERPEVPVVLATGFADLAPGVAPQLPRLAKPFGQKELAEAVRDVVGGKSN